MQPFFGLFNLGRGEIILTLALVFILVGAKKLPDLAKGLRLGIFEFRKAVVDEATEAGRSLGGIYGKPAAEALTHDNQVSELYDPDCLQNDSEPQKRSNLPVKVFAKIAARLRSLLRLNRHTS